MCSTQNGLQTQENLFSVHVLASSYYYSQLVENTEEEEESTIDREELHVVLVLLYYRYRYGLCGLAIRTGIEH